MATYKVTLETTAWKDVLVKAGGAAEAADIAQAEPEKQEWWDAEWQIDGSRQSLSVQDTEEWDCDS